MPKKPKPKKCWEGYRRKPGTKAGEKGSCVKKGKSTPKKKK